MKNRIIFPCIPISPGTQVVGVEDGATVELFTDSGCTVPASKGAGTAAGTSIVITSSEIVSAGTEVEGDYYYYAKVTDSAGNTNGCSTANVKYSLDTMPPQIPSIFIIDGVTNYTNLSGPALQLSATGAIQMYITNTAGCGSGGAWESYATSKASWTLGQSNSTATVYAKYKDGLGHETACVSDSIIHDDIAPTSPTISINGGAAATNSTSVTLTLSAVEASQMYVTNTAGCGSGGAWEAYSTSKAWTLAQTNTTATVYVKYRDGATNETSCVSDGILHDNTGPTGTISINAAAPYTNTTSVTLTLSATDTNGVTDMYVTNTAGCASGGAWEAYNTTKSWTLGQTNATATVYVRFRDSLLNLSTCVSDTIIHDITAPTQPASITYAASYTHTSESPPVTYGASTDGGSGIDHYELALTTNTALGTPDVKDWTSVGTTNPATLTGMTLETATYYIGVRAVDKAGNISTVRWGTGYDNTGMIDCAANIPSPGAKCTDGSIFLGIVNGVKYATTPGGCTDSSTPTCAGTVDTLTKSWGTSGINTGVVNHRGGARNTTALVAGWPAEAAAANYCNDLTYASASDWFLPSQDDLALFRTAVLDGFTISGLVTGTAPEDGYWSSTEGDSINANIQIMGDGTVAPAAKTQQQKVRCVRVIPDVCDGAVNPGTTCGDKTIYLGSLNGYKYRTTPGGCTDSPTPTCAGGTDTLKKTWGSSTTTTGAVSTNDGLANTKKLASDYSDTYSAKYCQDMTYGSITSWFLPAKEELGLFWSAKNAGYTISGLVTTLSGTYWSSTEYSTTSTHYVKMSNTSLSYPFATKTTSYYTRCVRKLGAPSTPLVSNAGANGSLSTSPLITWTSNTADGTSATFEVAFGTTPGGTDILNWTYVGSNQSYTGTGLNLSDGVTYYASVRSVDLNGNTSAIGTGPGWTAIANDPCAVESPALGTVCADGTIHIGHLNGYKYAITPGGCTDSANPVCNGSNDTITKYWGASGISTGVTSTTDGPGNSATLAANYSDTHAAKYCTNMNYGSHSDWFLPAADELYLLWLAKSAGYNPSGMTGSSYLSSTEYNASDAYYIYNWTSPHPHGIKNNSGYYIRCMRRYAITAPTVDDGVTSFDLTSASISWGVSGSLDGTVIDYELAIGSTAGATDIVNWTSVGNILSTTLTGLNLTANTYYYASVRSVDSLGIRSPVGKGDGWFTGDPCQFTPALGTICSGGSLYAGQFDTGQYMVTPSGCTDSATPTCAGGADTVMKAWIGSTGSATDIVGLTNISGASTPSPSSEKGDYATNIIVNSGTVSSDSAAHYCSNLVYGGYDDWYLPSKSELAYIYCHSDSAGTHNVNYPEENPDCTSYGGRTYDLTFNGNNYWTSSEYSSTAYAFAQSFNTGTQAWTTKSGISLVRCVRRF